MKKLNRATGSKPTQYHFYNLTGYILRDDADAQLQDTLALLRDTGSKQTTDTVYARTSSGQYQKVKVTIDCHGVVRLA